MEEGQTRREAFIPTVLSPLGIEPNNPRALWEGRFVNEFCIDVSFSMDNETALAILVSNFAFSLYLLCTTIVIVASSCTHVVNFFPPKIDEGHMT